MKDDRVEFELDRCRIGVCNMNANVLAPRVRISPSHLFFSIDCSYCEKKCLSPVDIATKIQFSKL